MAPRLQLHEKLKQLTDHVYFQPPSNVEIQFPCILYARDSSYLEYAGNQPYIHAKRYQVTVIDRNPDSPLADRVEELPYCQFERSFPAGELNHWIFNLFF